MVEEKEFIDLEGVDDIIIAGYAENITNIRDELGEIKGKIFNMLHPSNAPLPTQREFWILEKINRTLRSAETELEETYFNMHYRWKIKK